MLDSCAFISYLCENQFYSGGNVLADAYIRKVRRFVELSVGVLWTYGDSYGDPQAVCLGVPQRVGGGSSEGVPSGHPRPTGFGVIR